ncbi:biliverdin-producing heme oxygenase [Polaromonas sp.]|uniref:biliverdin-producing heme oxygenase n=1 Tax=Polaromonas sp. TaxID=1869339 RepID=UPI003750840F
MSVIVNSASQRPHRSAPLTSITSGAPSVLTRLRLETRAEHDAVERVLDLMGRGITLKAYRQQLARFYGFYGPLEAALLSRFGQLTNQLAGDTSQWSVLPLRLQKTRLLLRDLQHLGMATEDLPLCRKLPPVQTQAEMLGCMYVMEGATLGGQLITRHVRATLGVTAATGGAFFEGYADDTGKMWQAMRQLLVRRAVNGSTEDAMVKSAIATFASLRVWCDRSATAAPGCMSHLAQANQHA